MQIEGRVAVITGASSGLGEALAHELSRAGMRCILLARRKKELARVAAEIAAETGTRPATAVCDVTQPAELDKAIAALRDSLKDGVHLVVLNAGITMHGNFEDSTDAALRQIMELNFFGVVNTVRAFLPSLRIAWGQKKLVLISTPSGLYGIKSRFGYSASKAAAQAFIESIAHELKGSSITTAIYYPGHASTALRKSGISATGALLEEEQAESAKPPAVVARIFRRAIESDRRNVFTNLTGPFIYFVRVLAPGLLDVLIRRHK